MLFRNLSLFVFIVLLAVSCKKDDSLLKDPGTLNFSKDTVYFDTVFTRLPGYPYPRSINKRFMIRNPYKETVSVNVRLMRGSTSEFRINVDGLTANVIKDVEILPKDSAWVFVEATLEPNNQTKPALVRDSIEFETNGNRQYVQLAAYGWDAYYFKDSVFKGTTNLILKDKPYVIVNSIFVDNGATLNIGPGLHFYSTTNSTLLDTNNKRFNISTINVLGTLNINGTKEDSVVFEGDRLDPRYKDRSGQWRGIHYYRGSINNTIEHAVVKNAIIGLWVDSLPENLNPNLTINKTIVKNMSAYGILGLTAKIKMENSLVYNCGANTFLGYYGGDYFINNCTFYTSSSGRRDPHFMFNNQMRNDKKVVIKTYDISMTVLNSIVYGPNNIETEIFFDLNTNIGLIKKSDICNCLLRSKSKFGCSNNIFNKDPMFVDINKGNFKLKSGSPAIDAGDVNTATTSDLDNNSRTPNPDLGAYEFQ